MQPNLLIIYADQWRAQSCGYAGEADVRTPQLDHFCATALNCRQATAGTPVCTPARASLLTGLYPHRHGLFLNDVPLDPALPSLGKVFRAAGYRTAWVGKWHVDGHGRCACIPPERRHGFQYWKTLECTHDYHHSRYYDNDDPDLRVWHGYDAIAQADDLMAWIGNGTPRPFLGVLSWGPPHNPYHTAPEEFRRQYDHQALHLRANVPAESADEDRRNHAGYYAHCTALDTAFGKIMNALERAGLADNTIVLFTSDHGDFIGSHGLYDKQGPWEEAVRVPFLLRAPGRLTPGVSDVLIDSPDILPTLCGLADVRPPDEVQGRDLSSHLQRGTLPDDDCALLAAHCVFGNWPWIAAKRPPLYHAREYRGVRTARHTYVEDLRGPWLLYDNTADPCQLANLVNAPVHAATQRHLAALLQARLRHLGDEFLPGPEYVRRWGYTVDANGTVPCPGWSG